MNERLSKQHGVIRASKEYIVVSVDQVHIVTQVFYLLLPVNTQRYLQ